MEHKNNKINIVSTNRKANFNYLLLEKYTAGLVLNGYEIKSIREKKVNINDSYCVIIKNEIFIKQLYIGQYTHNNTLPCDEYRLRKLLLNKNEIIKIKNKINNSNTIIPTSIFINEKGLAKINIAIAKGKKLYDKRRSIKEKELKIKIREKY